MWGQLLVFEGRTSAQLQGFEGGQFRCADTERLTQLRPQCGGDDPHRIEGAPPQPQESNVQCQIRFVGCPVAGVNHRPLVATEDEKGLQFECAEFAWELIWTKVGGVPSLHRRYLPIGIPTIPGKRRI